MFVFYFWDRERQSMNGGGSEGEGDTESEAGSRLWAVDTEPDTGLKLTNHEIMTWTKVSRSTHWATQAPRVMTYFRYSEIENESQEFYIWQNDSSSMKSTTCYQHARTQGILFPWALRELAKMIPGISKYALAASTEDVIPCWTETKRGLIWREHHMSWS